ncbi:MAG: cytidine deaminase [Acidimicrobiales bacterium]
MSPTNIDHDLVQAAQEARSLAYVPYSRFAMGAAVRLDDDSIVLGALVENVSLGLAMCGERVALFASVCAGGDSRPVGLALVAPRTDGELTYPCGACLQVALELGGPDLAVVIADPDREEIVASTVGGLLPNGPRKDSRPG